jgi:hypothetical protein
MVVMAVLVVSAGPVVMPVPARMRPWVVMAAGAVTPVPAVTGRLVLPGLTAPRCWVIVMVSMAGLVVTPVRVGPAARGALRD